MKSLLLALFALTASLSAMAGYHVGNGGTAIEAVGSYGGMIDGTLRVCIKSSADFPFTRAELLTIVKEGFYPWTSPGEAPLPVIPTCRRADVTFYFGSHAHDSTPTFSKSLPLNRNGRIRARIWVSDQVEWTHASLVEAVELELVNVLDAGF